MIYSMFTIRDSATSCFSSPFAARSQEEGIRNFISMASDPRSLVCQFPHQYDLYELGTFDDLNGKQDLHHSPQHIMKGVEVQKIPFPISEESLNSLQTTLQTIQNLVRDFHLQVGQLKHPGASVAPKKGLGLFSTRN